MAALGLKEGYRETPIDLDGEGEREPCVEARSLGLDGDNHYNSTFNPPYYECVPGSIPGLYLRAAVGAKLVGVNARLAGLGVALYLFDAWRPQAIQRYFHDEWFPAYLKSRSPHLAGAALLDEVEKYWAAPSAGPSSPAPHATGGAVDLTLMFRETRQPLYMGGIFDDLTRAAWTDGFEPDLLSVGETPSMSDEEARANRRLLYWAMTEAGFANNPTEWWHYSWGDQLWARLTNERAAIYGACDPLAPQRLKGLETTARQGRTFQTGVSDMLNAFVKHVAVATGLTPGKARCALGIVLNAAERQGADMVTELYRKMPGARTLSAKIGADNGAATGVIARLIEQTPGGRRSVTEQMIRLLHQQGLGHAGIGALFPAIGAFAEGACGLGPVGHLGDVLGQAEAGRSSARSAS